MTEELNAAVITFRVALSLIFGGIIGFERGYKNQPAGFRTYMLVCLGAAMVMMTNQYISQVYHTGDPSRLGAQVISGIGFLGAGTIIVTAKNQVKGLTTAAGLWSAACLGLAVGIGFYMGGLIAWISIVLIMSVFSKMERHFRRVSPYCRLYTNFESNDSLNAFLTCCREKDITIEDMQLSRSREDVIVFWTVKERRNGDHAELIRNMAEIEGLKHIEEI